MKESITMTEIRATSTWSVKDDSPRGCKTVSNSKVKPGDMVVYENRFTLVIDDPEPEAAEPETTTRTPEEVQKKMKKELFNVADVEVLYEGGWYPYGDHNPAADDYTACYVRRETGRPFWVLLENWNGEQWETASRLPQGQNSSKVGAEIASGVRPVYIEDEYQNTYLIGLVF